MEPTTAIKQPNTEMGIKPPRKKLGIWNIFSMGFIAVLFFICGMFSGLYLITTDTSPDEGGERIVIITTTPVPGLGDDDLPEPTAAVDPYEGWVEYLFSDCNISVFAPPEWEPSAKGEDNTCGIFRVPVDNLATNFDNYNGLQVVFVPFKSDSKYSPIQAGSDTSKTYLEKMDSDPERRRDDRDFLLETYGSILSNTEATFAVVDRKELGKTYNIYYSASGDEFVIIWGGSDVEDNAETIDLMLKSIKFI